MEYSPGRTLRSGRMVLGGQIPINLFLLQNLYRFAYYDIYMRLIVIEDEPELADSIVAFLKKEKFLCDVASTLRKAESMIALYEYDCALVDIGLPDGSGLDLIQQIKKYQPRTGIIVISAHSSLDDKIRGLGIGADDYLSKPFHLAELNARIQSVLRRRKFEGSNHLKIHDIEVVPDSREVLVRGTSVELTRKEFDILLYFLSNKNRVLTKESIAEYVWGNDANTYDNFDFVYTHVKNLRKKLTDGGAEDYIQSVYGIGYKFSL